MPPAPPATTLLLPPPLKWAGGKRWLVPVLRLLYQPHRDRRLVEPFCGGLSVALGLAPERALLNDINPHLINFYRWLQHGPINDLPMANERALYYRYRERFNELVRTGQAGSREAALLFYYLNRTGFNGLCRFNREGLFNVPFGRYRRVRYVRDFGIYREVLARWEFRCGDFAELDLRPDDFVYADPPYDVPFTRYSGEAFAWDDQVRLARWLATHPGPVVASNQATRRVVELYRGLGFALFFLQGPRSIAARGTRGPELEVLAVKPVPGWNPEEDLRQSGLIIPTGDPTAPGSI